VTTRLKLSAVLLRAGLERLLVSSESRTALAVNAGGKVLLLLPVTPLHKGIDFKQVFDV